MPSTLVFFLAVSARAARFFCTISYAKPEGLRPYRYKVDGIGLAPSAHYLSSLKPRIVTGRGATTFRTWCFYVEELCVSAERRFAELQAKNVLIDYMTLIYSTAV